MDKAACQHIVKQHLQTAYLLSEEKAETMMPVFVSTLRAHMNRLAELAAAGDLEELSRASHAVRGALLNMGLTDLAQTAHSLEKQCKADTGKFDPRVLVTELHRRVALFGDER